MPLEITISDVPEDVYARLAARATLQEKSLEDYLQEELRRIARPISAAEWLEEVRKFSEREPTRVSSELIVQMLREARK